MFNKIRNIRKRWFVVTAAVALLAVGLVSGAAFAANGAAQHVSGGGFYYGDSDGYGHHEKGSGGGESRAQVMARVAEILGVEQSALEDAFKTALHEQADARFAAYAAKLVDEETITQEQADAAITWFAARPSKSGKLAGLAIATADTEKIDALLARMVTAEKLTQEQADAISAWHSDRPDALPEHEGKRSKKGRRGHHKGSGDNASGAEGSAG